MISLEECRHRWIADFGAGEIVCTLCGFVIPLYAPRAPRSPDDQSAIVSPGMVGGGLGSDIERSLTELNGNDGDGSDGTKLLSLKRLFLGNDNSQFWMSLTETLRDRGLPEVRIAMISDFLRGEIARMRREDVEQLKEIVRLALGVDL